VTRVLIADDDELMRAGLVELLIWKPSLATTATRAWRRSPPTPASTSAGKRSTGAISDFFDGELAGGRYSVLRERPTADGVTVELDFRRGGLLERLRDRYTIGDGRIRTLVATYR
jgi:hypothetical protein